MAIEKVLQERTTPSNQCDYVQMVTQEVERGDVRLQKTFYRCTFKGDCRAKRIPIIFEAQPSDTGGISKSHRWARRDLRKRCERP